MTDLQAPPSRRGGSAGGHVGDSPIRPDGAPKVQGRFAFASDLQADGMLWGRTLRSPHPHARIAALDVGPALAIPGVTCVVTADDVPGAATYGLIASDQPVFAGDVVRFVGEPVAAVAADHPDTARRALDAIALRYEVLPPLVDAAAAADAAPIHPDGNVIRRIVIDHGDTAATGSPTKRTTSRANTGWSAEMRPYVAAPGTSSAVTTHATPAMASAGPTSMDAMRAWGWGERRVRPHSMPSAYRSDEKAKLPCTLGTPSGRTGLSPTRPPAGPPRTDGRAWRSVMPTLPAR